MDPRISVMIPVIAAAVIAIAESLMMGASLGTTPTVVWLIVAALNLIAAINLFRHVRLPLAQINERARQVAYSDPPHSPLAIKGTGDIAEIAVHLNRIGENLIAGKKNMAIQKQEQAAQAEALRELNERYTLAVERANDGIWEWNIGADEVTFSARWQGMHGYSSLGPISLTRWKAMLHPTDREDTHSAFMRHVNGQSPYFDTEYRMTRHDGSFLWVHARGVALRHASGKPYRVIVMENDIDERKRMEETLIQAAEGLSSSSGLEFFHQLIQALASILGTRDNMVCRTLDDPPTRARAIAYFTRGEFQEPFDYELEGTSCGDVIKKREIVYCPEDVTRIWPLEAQYERESYIGIPMFDSNGRVIGHFACMDGKPMHTKLPHLALFKIFSVRAAAELERTILKEKLLEHPLQH